MKKVLLALFLLAAINSKAQSRYDSMIKHWDNRMTYLANHLNYLEMVDAALDSAFKRIDILQHRLDSMERRPWWWNGFLIVNDSVHTLTDKEKGFVPVNAQKKGGKP